VTAGVLLERIFDWYCPECGLTDMTREALPHTRFHRCAKLRGMDAPMVQQGTKARIRLVEREDYEGPDAPNVQRDPEYGRPVMAMRTERADGSNDVRVYAPVATGRLTT